MKKYSLAELQKMAVEHFDKLQVSKLYATTDGQFFLLESRARLHVGASGTIYQIDNDGDISVPEVKQPSISELKELVKDKNLEELNEMLAHEVATSNRKGAIDAISQAINALT